MTILPYLIIVGLLLTLGVRYLWLIFMTKCWEDTVAIYIVQSGRPVSDIALIAPTIPAWQMVAAIWTWYYPAFVINQQAFHEINSFFIQRAATSDSA